jgi:hypothetical protein
VLLYDCDVILFGLIARFHKIECVLYEGPLMVFDILNVIVPEIFNNCL